MCECDGLSFSKEPHPCFRVLATTCNPPSPRLRSVFHVMDEQSFPAIDMTETATLLSGAFSKERVQAACEACKQHCGTPTIRDVRHVLEIATALCQQTKKAWNDCLSHCLHLLFNTGTPLPLPPLPITFTSDRLDTQLFTELSSCVDAARAQQLLAPPGECISLHHAEVRSGLSGRQLRLGRLLRRHYAHHTPRRLPPAGGGQPATAHTAVLRLGPPSRRDVQRHSRVVQHRPRFSRSLLHQRLAGPESSGPPTPVARGGNDHARRTEHASLLRAHSIPCGAPHRGSDPSVRTRVGAKPGVCRDVERDRVPSPADAHGVRGASRPRGTRSGSSSSFCSYPRPPSCCKPFAPAIIRGFPNSLRSLPCRSTWSCWH